MLRQSPRSFYLLLLGARFHFSSALIVHTMSVEGANLTFQMTKDFNLWMKRRSPWMRLWPTVPLMSLEALTMDREHQPRQFPLVLVILMLIQAL